MTQMGKKILLFIQKNFQEDEERELADYINDNIEMLQKICEIKEDDADIFVDDYCYNSSVKYEKLAEELYKNNNECEEFSRITVSKRAGYYYISLSNYGKFNDNKLTEKYISRLDELCQSERKNRGELYEKFCKLWLQEFCYEVNLTPKRNDKGIDIIACVDADTSFDVIRKMQLQILVQVKLYKNKVDVPIVRHLLADSIFLSFSKEKCSMFKPTVLCVISHSGYTKGAIQFAKDYHVLLLDTKKMIRILEKKATLDTFQCIHFLDSIEFDNG